MIIIFLLNKNRNHYRLLPLLLLPSPHTNTHRGKEEGKTNPSAGEQPGADDEKRFGCAGFPRRLHLILFHLNTGTRPSKSVL